MIIIDGDILLYIALCNAETEIEFDEDMWTIECDHSIARDSFKEQVQKIVEDSGETNFHLCLTDPTMNWRKLIYPSYKSNRKNTRKPLGFREFRKWVEGEYPIVCKPSLEADDCLGILATMPKNKGKCIIWSIDKDLKQIPGKHLTPDGVKTVDESEADYWHFRQMLTGDAVDGYPGCPGVGAVKADKLLATEEYPWPAIVQAYEKAGLTEADALVQARIARICRFEDWDSNKQEVIKWVPKC